MRLKDSVQSTSKIKVDESVSGLNKVGPYGTGMVYWLD